MEITGLAGVEILGVAEDIPAQSSYIAAIGLLEIDVGELHSGVGDEDAAETLFNVLEISTSSKVIKTR
jgi:hypothetical protein